MSEPSGFGLLALYPGIVTDPPAFSFYRTGVSATLDQYIQSATGTPKLVYSLFTGQQVPLDLISGINDSFYFNQGKMKFGDGAISTAVNSTGILNVYWNRQSSLTTRAGSINWQTNSAGVSGSPASIIRNNKNPIFTEISNFVGDSAEFTSDLGGFRTATFPGVLDYTAANSLTNSTYQTPITNGADSTSFLGFGWGRWDGSQNLYTNLGVYQDYTEVGYFKQTSVKQSLGGRGALVLRNANVNPTSYHTSGISFYARSSDSSLNVKTQNGTEVQLAPGISGIDRLAFSDNIHLYLSSRLSGGSVEILSTDNGKVLVDDITTTHTISFNQIYSDGFSCKIHYSKDCGYCDFDNTLGDQFLQGNPVFPGRGEKSTIAIINDTIYLNHSVAEYVAPIFLQTNQFIKSQTSGASTGFFETTTFKNNYQAFVFNQSLPQSIEAEFILPPQWSGFYCVPRFTSLSGTSSHTSKWNFSARSEENTSTLDRSFSTPISSISTYSASGLLYNLTTSTIYPSGIYSIYPPVSNLIKLKMQRDASHVVDTLAADAFFLGMSIYKSNS